MTHIIIVDDEKEILDPLEEMLSGEGYRVSAFSNPKTALDFISKKNVDIAVFDIKMPEMNGYELLTQARNIHQNLPVIFLSSKSDEQDQIIGFTLGADDFVTKPFSKHLLLFRIKSVLKRHTPEMIAIHKPIVFNELSIDIDRHLVTWNNEIVNLTLRIQNVGLGLSEKVDFSIIKNHAFSTSDFTGLIQIKKLNPGDYQDIDINVKS